MNNYNSNIEENTDDNDPNAVSYNKTIFKATVDKIKEDLSYTKQLIENYHLKATKLKEDLQK